MIEDVRDPGEVIHLMPPLAGNGLTPCCRKTPFSLPHTDRLTADPEHVTCVDDGANEELRGQEPLRLKANLPVQGIVIDLEIDRVTRVIRYQGQEVGRVDSGVIEAIVADSLKGLSIRQGPVCGESWHTSPSVSWTCTKAPGHEGEHLNLQYPRDLQRPRVVEEGS